MKTEIAMLCLTALEIVALVTHTDGVYFMPIVGAIAAMGGFVARGRVEKAARAFLGPCDEGKGAAGGRGR